MRLVSLLIAFILGLCQGQKEFRNPILDDIAPDPSILKHEGFYYMVYSQGDRIEILQSSILSNFRGAQRRQIYHVPQGRANLWAPDIHKIRGDLYIYFTMDDGASDANHRMYVIKCNNPMDPLGTWSSEVRLLADEEIYAIDGTVLQFINGELYFIWTGFPDPPGKMNLYISRMQDPMMVVGPRRFLREPTMDWEMHDFPVNGAPYVLQSDGRTFLVFSASSTFHPDYCLGIMGIDDYKDPLFAKNWWNDVSHCAFHRNDGESVFGTGGASFVRSPGKINFGLKQIIKLDVLFASSKYKKCFINLMKRR